MLPLRCFLHHGAILLKFWTKWVKTYSSTVLTYITVDSYPAWLTSTFILIDVIVAEGLILTWIAGTLINICNQSYNHGKWLISCSLQYKKIPSCMSVRDKMIILIGCTGSGEWVQMGKECVCVFFFSFFFLGGGVNFFSSSFKLSFTLIQENWMYCDHVQNLTKYYGDMPGYHQFWCQLKA